MASIHREKPLNVAEFIAKRRKVELKERPAAKEHLLNNRTYAFGRYRAPGFPPGAKE